MALSFGNDGEKAKVGPIRVEENFIPRKGIGGSAPTRFWSKWRLRHCVHDRQDLSW